MATSAATTATLLTRPSAGGHRIASSSYPSSSAAHGRSRLLPIRCQSPGVDKTKPKRNLFDNASNLLTNLLAGGNLKNMPVAEGAVTDLFDRPLFYSLYDWFLEHGSVYKLAFGPKSFVVVSDPIVARYILRENAFAYDKGVLAEILEPIMGKGLIPADLDTWKQRRKVITPGFHGLFIEAMVRVFTKCSERTILKPEERIEKGDHSDKSAIVNLEEEFSNLALDIIGLGVFNFDFDSVNKESPVIKAVYGTLFEAEHRSTFYIPYWNLPLTQWIVPRQRKFRSDLKVINDCLDNLIKNAKETRQEADVEKLQQRDYSSLKDASLLRFLVDMRGADVDDRQLRDDLMTMLIAGHETTAAVLTWSIFLLAQNPAKMRKAQAEIDAVLNDGAITADKLKKLDYYSQKRFLDSSKGLKRFSLMTSSPFGRPGVSLNDEDLVKDKLLIDCGDEQDCVLDGIVALGKFDALHIGHRELAMHASKSGNPFLLSFVGMAKVLGWEYRPPIVAPCDRKRVLSSWATYCRNVVPLEYQVEFSKVRYLTPHQFVEKLSKDLRIKGVVAGENYRFGYKASGDAAELAKLCEEFGLSSFIVRSVMDTAKRSYNGATPVVNSSDKGQVSSSRVRHALSVGDIEYVSKLLGRKHRLVLAVSEYSLKERKNVTVPRSCMLNMPPADGFYENCELFNGGYLGLCRVAINSETIDIEMKDESSLPQNPFQEDQQLGIEFG